MKRIIALIGLVFLSNRLLSQTTVEEPVNFIDVAPSNPVTTITNDVSAHCFINPANDANSFNFSLQEFHSKDGELVPIAIRGNIQVLMNQLQALRDEVGLPIIITSGYRSMQHNINVGGAEFSQHLCGTAADFYIQGMTNNEVQNTILYLIAQGRMIDGGLGRYNNFTHYDIGASRRWDKR